MALRGIGRPASTEFFKLKRNIWRAASTGASASAQPCPAQLSFEMKLPPTYRGRTLKERPLPPSCAIALPACAVVCKYTLTIAASKAPRLGVLTRKRRCAEPERASAVSGHSKFTD